MKYYFKAFGLNIQSDFPFHGIKIPEKGFFDISIVKGQNPLVLSNYTYKGINFENNKTEFLLKIPNVASFLVQNGKKVIIDVNPQAQLKEVELFFLGSVMAIILTQRNVVPFHGSAFKKDDKCIIISGSSGAGKSSLLRYFISQGYKALTDDVCALSTNPKNEIMLTPSYPSSKIWEDVMDKFELPKEDNKKIRPKINKYKYSFSEQFVETPLKVEAIYILLNHNKPDFKIEAITGIEKFKYLRKNIYRHKFPIALNKEKETFQILNLLAQQSKLFFLTRSSDFDLLDQFNRYAKEQIIG